MKLVERKHILIRGRRLEAEVPRRLTPREKEERLERLYKNIARIAERQKSS